MTVPYVPGNFQGRLQESHEGALNALEAVLGGAPDRNGIGTYASDDCGESTEFGSVVDVLIVEEGFEGDEGCLSLILGLVDVA